MKIVKVDCNARTLTHEVTIEHNGRQWIGRAECKAEATINAVNGILGTGVPPKNELQELATKWRKCEELLSQCEKLVPNNGFDLQAAAYGHCADELEKAL
jgi:hypothetical protein